MTETGVPPIGAPLLDDSPSKPYSTTVRFASDPHSRRPSSSLSTERDAYRFMDTPGLPPKNTRLIFWLLGALGCGGGGVPGCVRVCLVFSLTVT